MGRPGGLGGSQEGDKGSDRDAHKAQGDSQDPRGEARQGGAPIRPSRNGENQPG